MDLLARYVNGNLTTSLYSDGTRTRFTTDDEFCPAFAENVDVHISDCCDNGCEMCYAGCTPKGHHAHLFDWKFLDSLHPGTEMAINLNFPVHPRLTEFLQLLKDKGIIVNATVNQVHFEKYQETIIYLYSHGLIHGLGVSLVKATHEFVEQIKEYPNAVIHVINGILDKENYLYLADNGLKLLILGYKNTGRGGYYYTEHYEQVKKNMWWLHDKLPEVPYEFKVVSFDNLALEQLNVRRLLTKEEWERFYGGDDGSFTFFINMVAGYFAKNSVSSVHYQIGDKTMDEMFEIVRKEKNVY